jgi:hypothetical protein
MPFANRARAYDPDADELLHRDLFVDLLHSLVTRHGGSYADIARRSGLSWRYLKYIHDKQRAIPLPATLDRIIAALPRVTEHEAKALREFARRASLSAEPAGTMRLVMEPTEVVAELRRLLDANHRALHAEMPDPAWWGFLDLRIGTVRTLAQMRDLLADPATSSHLFILLCNILNLLDDPGAALKAARVARQVLEMHSERSESSDPRLDALRVESVRAEAMTFHNLGQDRAALVCYDEAERLLAASPHDPQRTYVALGRISAMVETRRFRLRDVQALVDDVNRACDEGHFSELEAPLLLHQARRGLARAYIRHGDLKPRTGRIVQEELDGIASVAFAGPIHRVQLYRTAADLSVALGDRRGAEDFLLAGITTAETEGLAHQAHRLGELLARPAVSGAEAG